MVKCWVFCIGALFMLEYLVLVSAGKDYYQILGVAKDASTRQIGKSYRLLSKEWHPDKRRGDPNAAQKFAEISEAYEVLSDDEKRRVYDQYGEEGLKSNGAQQFRSPFDIFSNFGFGGGFGGHNHQHAEQRKGPNIEIPLEVTLKDLYLGKTFTVAHKKQVLCPKCRGTGAKDAQDVSTCPDCNGSGVKIKTTQLGPGFMTQSQTTCDRCNGKGKVVKSKCPFCKGTKVHIDEDKINVFVERGMQDRHQIVFEQEADEVPETIPGDVIFKIITLPHKKFTRDGDNLHLKMTITLLEALVGFKKTFKHLDGHDVVVSRNEVTKPGEVVVLEEEGMPQHNYASQMGNLYIEFSIKMPTSVTEEQKKKDSEHYCKNEAFNNLQDSEQHFTM